MKIDVKPYSYAISGSIVCLVTKSEDESIRLKEYLESVDIKQIVKYKKLIFTESSIKELEKRYI